MTRRFLYALGLVLSLSLFTACADLPDDPDLSTDVSDQDAAELEQTKQAIVLPGFPSSIKASPILVSNPSGRSWTSARSITLSQLGSPTYGVQLYKAGANESFLLSHTINTFACTVYPSGGWICGPTVIQCPTVRPYSSPDSYALSSAPSSFIPWTTNGSQSWYSAGGGGVVQSAVIQQMYTAGQYQFVLVCGYGAGVQNYGLAHY